MAYAVAYLVTLVTFLAVDMVWLGTMAARVYRPTLGDIAIAGVHLPPAIAFYLVYPIGLLIFAINPAINGGTVATAAVYGALFGFFTYMTYDLTNWATLRNWTVQLALIDISWGTVLAAAAAAAGFWVERRLMGAA